MLKKILSLFFVALFAATVSKAQISVTATVGTAGPTTYTTLKLAFDAINAGTHKGVIAISITGNTTETASASLNASGTGSSSYTAITISPSGTNTISGNLNGDLIVLNGADNVTIDGLNDGTNTLTIQNTNAGAAASTLYFNNEATANIVKNCFIKGSSIPTLSSGSLTETTATRAVITFGATASSLGNSNNIIQSCDIGPYSTSLPWSLIYSNGNATYLNKNNIVNNTMYDFHYNFAPTSPSTNRNAAVFLSSNNNAWAITGNKIFQTASRALGTWGRVAAIYVKSGQGHTITGNLIGGSAADNSGTMTYTGIGWSFSGIECVGLGTVNKTLISGNTIKNIDFTTSIDQNYSTTSNPRFTAVFVSAGYYSINNNSIGSSLVDASTSPSISITASGSTYANYIGMIWSFVTGGGAIIDSICGNQMGGIKINSSNIGNTNSPPFYASGIVTYYDKVSKLDNNVIGSLTTANSIYITGNSPVNNASYSAFGFYGIRSYSANATSPIISISGNVVANINMYVTGTLNASVGALAGIDYTVTSDAVVNNNTIQGLTTNFGTYTTNGNNGEIYGVSIFSTTTGTSLEFSGNKISQLNSVVNSVTGAYIFISGTSTSKITSRNQISQLTAGYNIIGLRAYNGSTTSVSEVRNNIVSINSSTSQSINGIQTNGAANCYFNTVYLSGSSAGNAPTFGLACYTYDATKLITIKNNLLFNNRVRTSGSTFYNSCIFLASGLTGVTINNNNYYAPNAGGSIGAISATTTVYTTIAAFRTATSQDANSININPSFINASGTLAEHFIPTAAGLNGVTGTGVVTDYYNVTRNATTPTIGALDYSMLWKGDVDNTWNNASNWTPSIPGTTDQVTFSAVAANDLNLDQDRTCGSINFNGSNKKMILGAYNVTPGTVYYPTSTSFIKTNSTGVVKSTIANGGSYLFATGVSAYNPVTITNNSGASDLFTALVLDEVYQNGASGATITWSHVKRTWDITKATANGGSGVDLLFGWNAGEVAGNMSNPSLYHYENSAWAVQSGTTASTSNSLTYTGYAGTFSPFAIGNNSIALPVLFSSLYATKDGKVNKVYWSTASEENNKGFEIQRSLDGVNFAALGFVNSLSATGNSSSRLNYSFIDFDPIGLKQYYRLKQTDFDGTSRYSGVVVVTSTPPQKLLVNSIYPNPATSFVHLSLMAPDREALQLAIIDVNGRTIRQKLVSAEIGNNSFELDVTGLSAGIYYLSLNGSSTGWQSVGRFVKK